MSAVELPPRPAPGAKAEDCGNLVDGERRPGAGARLDVNDPFTGQTWARVPDSGEAEVREAVASSRRAFLEGPWAGALPATRAKLLHRFADLVERHAAELTQLQARENGKAVREQHAQTLGLSAHLRFFAGVAETITGQTIPVSARSTFHYTVREPLGVVAALTPWNSPLALLMWKLAPALAAGNTVVVKPSEVSPVSTLRLAELAQEAGFPPGVVNVVTGGAEAGRQLVAHPDVALVAFTGSTAAGRQIAAAAGGRLARCTLELGGKSPNIVFDDADLDAAVEGVVGGIFAAAGQTCIAGSRVLVQAAIHDELVERLVRRTARIRLGDPLSWDTEVGTIASPAQLDKVRSYVDVAASEGAELVAGGGAPDGADGPALFFAPTIFTRVKPEMRIAREEVFGPIAAVLPFDDEADAVRIANDTAFGLGAGVWTSDVGRALRMASSIRSGTVWINTYRKTNYVSPFGGFGDSGIGRENGADAVHEFTATKTVWIDTGSGIADPFNPFA
ncbi:MAG TPA: aldehyde dehydrogenase [Baekduia sp.]|nr:aldehyde dehydrogenase [Baekduia sp.]